MPTRPRVSRRPPARTLGDHVAVMILELRGLPTTAENVDLVAAACSVPIQQLQRMAPFATDWIEGNPVGLRIREA